MNPASTPPRGEAGMPHDRRSPRGQRPPGRGRRERAVVLGPPGLAIAATFFGFGADFIAPVWLAAIAWTVPASFALALHAGLRHGDWSAFRNHKHAPDREEESDLDSHVGAYAFMREREDVLASRDPRRSADPRHDLS